MTAREDLEKVMERQVSQDKVERDRHGPGDPESKVILILNHRDNKRII